MLLVLLMTMATASLSASFAIFLVRERANKSKHVQVGQNFVLTCGTSTSAILCLRLWCPSVWHQA